MKKGLFIFLLIIAAIMILLGGGLFVLTIWEDIKIRQIKKDKGDVQGEIAGALTSKTRNTQLMIGAPMLIAGIGLLVFAYFKRPSKILPKKLP